MATLEDARRLALSLPETTEKQAWGQATWRVKDKMFVWERPLRTGDLAELGDAAPDGEILGVRVEHLVAKEAMIADAPETYFTTSHFDGHPMVLVRLDEISLEELEEITVEAWLDRAPKKLRQAFLDAEAADSG